MPTGSSSTPHGGSNSAAANKAVGDNNNSNTTAIMAYKPRTAIPIELFAEHVRRLNADTQCELEREFSDLREHNEKMQALAASGGRLPPSSFVILSWPFGNGNCSSSSKTGGDLTNKIGKQFSGFSAPKQSTSRNQLPTVSLAGSMLSANRTKNRYSNILVYDHTRVVLGPMSNSALAIAFANSSSSSSKTLDSVMTYKCSHCHAIMTLPPDSTQQLLATTPVEPAAASATTASTAGQQQTGASATSNSDYINASWISDAAGVPGAYIATQGPLQHTCGDFWSLVWQHNVHNIIMLTNVIESGRSKCDIYWPQHSHRPLRFGCIEVELVSEMPTAFCIVRDFIVRLVKSSNNNLESKKEKSTSSRRCTKQSSIATVSSRGGESSSTTQVFNFQQQTSTSIERLKSSSNNTVSNGNNDSDFDIIVAGEQHSTTMSPPAHCAFCNSRGTMCQVTSAVATAACGGFIQPLSAPVQLPITSTNAASPSQQQHRASTPTTNNAAGVAAILPGSSSVKRLFSFVSKLSSSSSSNSGSTDRRSSGGAGDMIFSRQPIPLVALGRERRVRQWHYTDWPDHGRPTFVVPLLRFIMKSSRKSYCTKSGSIDADNDADAVHNDAVDADADCTTQSDNSTKHLHEPLLLHCSAGVGRTGCYIVIHSMIQQILRHQCVDVFNYVSSIRRERMGMVQTESQYELIHDALLEFVRSGQTECSISKFEQYFRSIIAKPISSCAGSAAVGARGDSQFEKQINLIAAQHPQFVGNSSLSSTSGTTSHVTPANAMSETLQLQQTKFACARANAGKNNCQRYVPSDDAKFRVSITPLTAVFGSDYVNASFVPGYFSAREHILTQFPARSTVGDFWQMIIDNRVPVVIIIHAVLAQEQQLQQQQQQLLELYNSDEAVDMNDNNTNGSSVAGVIENVPQFASFDYLNSNDLTTLSYADRFIPFWPTPSLYQSSSPQLGRIDAAMMDEIVMVANSSNGIYDNIAVNNNNENSSEAEQQNNNFKQTMLVRERSLKVVLDNDDEFYGFPSVLLSVAPRINRNIGGLGSGANMLSFASPMALAASSSSSTAAVISSASKAGGSVLPPLPSLLQQQKQQQRREGKHKPEKLSIDNSALAAAAGVAGGVGGGGGGGLAISNIKQPQRAAVAAALSTNNLPTNNNNAQQQLHAGITPVRRSLQSNNGNNLVLLNPQVRTFSTSAAATSSSNNTHERLKADWFNNGNVDHSNAEQQQQHSQYYLSDSHSENESGSRSSSDIVNLYAADSTSPSAAAAAAAVPKPSPSTVTPIVPYESIINEYDDDARHFCRVIELPFYVDALSAASFSLVNSNNNIADGGGSEDCNTTTAQFQQHVVTFLRVFLRLMDALRIENLVPKPSSSSMSNVMQMKLAALNAAAAAAKAQQQNLKLAPQHNNHRSASGSSKGSPLNMRNLPNLLIANSNHLNSGTTDNSLQSSSIIADADSRHATTVLATPLSTNLVFATSGSQLTTTTTDDFSAMTTKNVVTTKLLPPLSPVFSTVSAGSTSTCATSSNSSGASSSNTNAMGSLNRMPSSAIIMDEFGGAKAAFLSTLMSVYNQIDCSGTIDVYTFCHMINLCRPNAVVGGMATTSTPTASDQSSQQQQQRKSNSSSNSTSSQFKMTTSTARHPSSSSSSATSTSFANNQSNNTSGGYNNSVNDRHHQNLHVYAALHSITRSMLTMMKNDAGGGVAKQTPTAPLLATGSAENLLPVYDMPPQQQQLQQRIAEAESEELFAAPTSMTMIKSSSPTVSCMQPVSMPPTPATATAAAALNVISPTTPVRATFSSTSTGTTAKSFDHNDSFMPSTFAATLTTQATTAAAAAAVMRVRPVSHHSLSYRSSSNATNGDGAESTDATNTAAAFSNSVPHVSSAHRFSS